MLVAEKGGEIDGDVAPWGNLSCSLPKWAGRRTCAECDAQMELVFPHKAPAPRMMSYQIGIGLDFVRVCKMRVASRVTDMRCVRRA